MADVSVHENGRQVVRPVPLDATAPTMGSVTLIAGAEDEFLSTGEPWNAD
jgi:hypothetical protein